MNEHEYKQEINHEQQQQQQKYTSRNACANCDLRLFGMVLPPL